MMSFKTFKTLVQANCKIPGNTPLGCILKRWKEEGYSQELDKNKMIDYCNRWWPEYEIGEAGWPVNGTLELGIMESLMHFLRRNEKWDEIPYLDLFLVLYRKEEWQKECGILVLGVNDERECVGCKERKERNLYPPIEEDLSYCVAPPRVPVVPNVPLAPPADITTRQGRKGQKGPQLIAPLREARGTTIFTTFKF